MRDDEEYNTDGYENLRRELASVRLENIADDNVAELCHRLERRQKGRIAVAESYLHHLLDARLLQSTGRCEKDPAMEHNGQKAMEALHYAKQSLDDMEPLAGPARYPDEVFAEVAAYATDPQAPEDPSERRRAIRKLTQGIGYPNRKKARQHTTHTPTKTPGGTMTDKNGSTRDDFDALIAGMEDRLKQSRERDCTAAETYLAHVRAARQDIHESALSDNPVRRQIQQQKGKTNMENARIAREYIRQTGADPESVYTALEHFGGPVRDQRWIEAIMRNGSDAKEKA